MIYQWLRRWAGRRGEGRPRTPERTVHVVVSGLVQGVGYRAWTRREAEARGLSGWVCNRLDGSVEAVFSGDAEAVAAMLLAVHSGPFGAEVEAVAATDRATVEVGPFTVKPTR
jgi:acylphosphatase